MIVLADYPGIHWPLLLSQAASFIAVTAVFVGLSIHATRRVLRSFDTSRDETRMVVWIAVVWMVPMLGALLAMSAADSILRERSARQAPKSSA